MTLRLLVVRAHTQLCSIPAQLALETFRPLPIEPLPGAPSYVSGVALVRARPTPVIDVRRLLGTVSDQPPTRYLTLRLDRGERVVALAVDEVIGIRDVPRAQLEALPGMLHGDRGLVQALGALDSALLLVLEHARLLPEALWQQLESERASA